MEVAGSHSKLYITGHSLGGATAFIFATYFCLDEATPERKRVFLCTFGQPLVGNQAFVDSARCFFIPGALQSKPGMGGNCDACPLAKLLHYRTSMHPNHDGQGMLHGTCV